MPVKLVARFEDRFGVPINPPGGVRKAGTVGTGLGGQEVAIMDEHCATVTDGSAGEVVVRGPMLMRGYLNRPDETAKTIVDGWLHTGDIGRLDDEGCLILVDRMKDMIIGGGENVYPKRLSR
jgi:long-chain acyl-CoA synthetase